MSNSPRQPSNNPLVIFFKRVINLITHQRLANFAQISPLLLAILLTISSFLVGFNSSALWATLNPQSMNKNFQNQVCKSYVKLVTERLNIEDYKYKSINTSPVDNKNNNINLQMPFSCEYTIENTENPEEKKFSIGLELNPLFSDLIIDSYDNFEQKIDLEDVCKHSTIIEQMETKSRQQGNFKEGDTIEPGKPQLLESKKDLYPVFQWVCNYQIKKPKLVKTEGSKETEFQGRTMYNIDLEVEPYCVSKAQEGEKELVKPTHHNYRDPYSLYCVRPNVEK